MLDGVSNECVAFAESATSNPWSKTMNDAGDASSEVDPAEVRLLHCMPAFFCFKKVKTLSLTV